MTNTEDSNIKRVLINKRGADEYYTIDEEDFERVREYKWHIGTNGYLVSNTHVKLHRLIIGVTDTAVFVRHINGDKLDNRKANLQIITPAQKMYGVKARANNKSGFKGVGKCRTMWCAQIKINGESIRLGSFPTPEAAARAFDEAARIHHGEFGTYNFPREGERSALSDEMQKKISAGVQTQPETKPEKEKVSRKCEHGCVKYTCIKCGGTIVCEHGRDKRRCVECGGSAICKHQKIKYSCKACRLEREAAVQEEDEEEPAPEPIPTPAPSSRKEEETPAPTLVSLFTTSPLLNVPISTPESEPDSAYESESEPTPTPIPTPTPTPTPIPTPEPAPEPVPKTKKKSRTGCMHAPVKSLCFVCMPHNFCAHKILLKKNCTRCGTTRTPMPIFVLEDDSNELFD